MSLLSLGSLFAMVLWFLLFFLFVTAVGAGLLTGVLAAAYLIRCGDQAPGVCVGIGWLEVSSHWLVWVFGAVSFAVWTLIACSKLFGATLSSSTMALLALTTNSCWAVLIRTRLIALLSMRTRITWCPRLCLGRGDLLCERIIVQFQGCNISIAICCKFHVYQSRCSNLLFDPSFQVLLLSMELLLDLLHLQLMYMNRILLEFPF